MLLGPKYALLRQRVTAEGVITQEDLTPGPAATDKQLTRAHTLDYVDRVQHGRLSDREIRVRVDVRGRQEADVVTQVVPATRYTALRIVFTEIEVEIESGLVVNGVTVTGPVDVELEDATLEVVRAISVDVGEGARAELVVDLNTTAWLQNVDPDLKRVAEEVFAQADLSAATSR